MENIDILKLLEVFNYWKDFTQPTEFYCEGWLTRILIFSVTDYGLKEHDLYVNDNYKCFSESLLYSPFLARTGGNKSLAEKFTYADSAIGEFEIGVKNKGSLTLTGNNLKIIEAKIYSKFSSKVTNSNFYNQAARYIACITETIHRADKIKFINDLSISLYLVVPESQFYKEKTFEEYLSKKHIREMVEKRIEQYKVEECYDERKDWFNNDFSKVLDKIEIKTIFYEDVISSLKEYKYYNEIKDYYNKCLTYNNRNHKKKLS